MIHISRSYYKLRFVELGPVEYFDSSCHLILQKMATGETSLLSNLREGRDENSHELTTGEQIASWENSPGEDNIDILWKNYAADSELDSEPRGLQVSSMD